MLPAGSVMHMDARTSRLHINNPANRKEDCSASLAAGQTDMSPDLSGLRSLGLRTSRVIEAAADRL